MRLVYLVAVALCTVAAFLGCSPAYGANPQSTLRLPTSTLGGACPCPCPCGTGVCTCAAGTCQCPSCPGLKRQDGINATREGAIASSRQYACPMVAWINLPPRSIKGTVGYHETGTADTRARIVVWTEHGGTEELSAGVTDADVLESVARCLRQAPVVNVALAAPPMPWQPMAMSGCAGGNCR